MEWFLTVVALGGAASAAKVWRARQSRRRTTAAELDVACRLADEDAAHLGDLLRRTDDHELDDESRAARRLALDWQKSALGILSQVKSADEISEVTERIASARYALACVDARLTGNEVPEPRVVCFFDPRHGLSAIDVLWNRPGHGPRRVPACQQDADLLADKKQPAVRTVKRGATSMPYWASGNAFLGYTRGYFASTATLSWALHPEVVDEAPRAAGHFGGGIVGSSGHFDGGGWDGSGGGGGA